MSSICPYTSSLPPTPSLLLKFVFYCSVLPPFSLYCPQMLPNVAVCPVYGPTAPVCHLLLQFIHYCLVLHSTAPYWPLLPFSLPSAISYCPLSLYTALSLPSTDFYCPQILPTDSVFPLTHPAASVCLLLPHIAFVQIQYNSVFVCWWCKSRAWKQ